MGKQLSNLLKRVTNVFNVSPNSVFYQILSGAGAALDQVDPAQTNLAKQFSITTATGSALDSHGADWQVPRRYNETDDSYRQRLLAALPNYVSAPTVDKIKAVVRAFTGVDPDIFEYGPQSFIMGTSIMGEFGFSHSGEAFIFQVTVKNPNNISYNQQDLIDAVTAAQPARSTAQFVFQ